MSRLLLVFALGMLVSVFLFWGVDCRRAAEMNLVSVRIANRTEDTLVVRSSVEGPAIPANDVEVGPGKTVEVFPWPYDNVPPLETNVELQIIVNKRTFAIQMSATDIAKLSTMHGQFHIEATANDLLVSFLGDDLVD